MIVIGTPFEITVAVIAALVALGMMTQAFRYGPNTFGRFINMFVPLVLAGFLGGWLNRVIDINALI